ncbi:MAG: 3-carboxymuconate cyclase [Chthoniobacteraceae bacterium]|nr:3-carboxymuconate cyclase [Chthoniobacteraceae bacterium]
MRFIRRCALVLMTLTALLTASPVGRAQTYKTLYSDNSGDGGGRIPYGKLVEGSDGNFYGTTCSGGAKGRGTVYKMTPGGEVSTLISFNSINGANPKAGLARGSDGNFYGTTAKGGANDLGTVFRISADGVLTTLAIFSSANGAIPMAALVNGPDGNFYGTTSKGGTSDFGTVFKLTPEGALTMLVSFGSSDGHTPLGDLIVGSDGNFYGTTSTGGALNVGTLFRMTPAGALTTLISFDGTNGSTPSAGLVQASNGDFYGTTYTGGSNDYGTVFKMTSAGVLTTLVSFNGPNGYHCSAQLAIGKDGNFYGTIPFSSRASIEATVFKLTPAGVFTTLVAFNPYRASTVLSSVAGLVQGSDGSFYGTTAQGGTGPSFEEGFGSGFKVTPEGMLTTIHFFGHGKDFYPSRLIEGSDGAFYGTTQDGANAPFGTLFRVTAAGTFTSLASFGSPNGSYPAGELVEDKDGNFYGTTSGGGQNSAGTVFKCTPKGTLTTLVSFNKTNGSIPMAGLLLASDGNFYGTTSSGGNNDVGTIFKMTPAGTITSLFSFNSITGSHPYAALIEGSDGNFYGTTYRGGLKNLGTVYKMTPGGEVTTLVSFNSINGAYPKGPLLLGSDFNLYGVTSGINDLGTIFKVTPTGTFTTLIAFNGINGSSATAGLVMGSNGSIYGTTTTGGSNGTGTLFKVTRAGALTTLYSFDVSYAGYPYRTPVLGSDGKFYGTANQMVIWQLDLTAGVPVISTSPATAITATTATLGGTVMANAMKTVVSFQYGLTSNYGSTAAATPSSVNGMNPKSVTATLSKLSPNTVYHFRLAATNSQGVAYGPDTLFVTQNGASGTPAPVIALQPQSQQNVSADDQAVFQVNATGTGPLTYQWFKNGAAVQGATGPSLTVVAVTPTNAGSYTAVISGPDGKVKTEPALLTVADPGLLIYKVAGTETASEDINATKGAVNGRLVLDRASQRAAILWTGKQGTQKIYWIEQRPDLATHSTGPVPKSTTLVTGDTATGEHPDIEHDLFWLKGTDVLITISSIDQTVAPAVMTGIAGQLTLGTSPKIVSLTLSAVIDRAASAASRVPHDTLEAALIRLGNSLADSGYIKVVQ